MRALMGANLPPRFVFKDTYDSIEVPVAYEQHVPTQEEIEDKFDELEAEEKPVQARVLSGGMTVASNLEVGNSNLFVDTETGRVGIGTNNPQVKLDVSGSAIISSNLEVGNSNLFVDTETGNVGIGSTKPTQKLDVKEGNALIGYDVITDETHNFPTMISHGPIGREDLYTWEGSTHNIVNTANQQNEPFYYNSDSSFKRLQAIGNTSLGTGYYASKWNYSNMIFFDFMNQDTRGNITTPTHYTLLSLPVAWLNNKTCSHALFLKFIGHDRWSACCAYVTNSSKTTFYRLQANVNTHSGTATAYTSSFWLGPDGGVSHGQLYHEWQMFSIPEYVIENYSYSETRDGKSKYNRNINIAFISAYGNTNGDGLYLSGIAMRTNPYGLTYHNALCAHWYINGGTGTNWYSGDWNYTILGQIDVANYTNIYIPICPPKDPDVYGYPDFYLCYIGHRSDIQIEHSGRWYLQHSNGTYKYLGRPSRMYGGKYGKVLNLRGDRASHTVGVYVPSPDPNYIVKVLGRPYLRIRIDNRNTIGWNNTMHPRGFYTEVVYRDGSTTDGLGWGGQMYI